MKFAYFAALAAVLAISMLAIGCVQSTKAPDKVQPTKYAPADNPPSQEIVPNEELPAEVVAAPHENATVPLKIAEPPAEPKLCDGKFGSDLAECMYLEARNARNVTLCEQAGSKDGRLSCIARWCLSDARNFSQCGSLKDNDDRLGCLNKCNPNQNT